MESVPGLRWLGHAAVLLEGPPAVYVDPWRLEGWKSLPAAALVLVTHAHFDHCSPESVARVAGEWKCPVMVALSVELIYMGLLGFELVPKVG